MVDVIKSTIESYGFLETQRARVYENKESGKKFYLGRGMGDTLPGDLVGQMPCINILVLGTDISVEKITELDNMALANNWFVIYDPTDEYEYFMKDLWNIIIQL